MKAKIKVMIWAVFIAFSFVQTPLRAQWTPVLTHDSLVCLAVVNTDTVFAAGNKEILRTYDGGISWQNVLPASAETNFYDMEVEGSTIYASGNGKILKTTDYGNSWNIIRQNPSAYYKKMSFANNQLGLVLVKSAIADTLLRTTDGGTTWQAISFTFPEFSSNVDYSLQMLNQSTGYFLTDKLFKTIDGGNTWIQLASYGTNMPFQSTTGNLIGFANPDVGIVLNSDYSDWKKTNDGGITWEAINRIMYTASGIVALHPDVYYICLADGFFFRGGNYVTTDTGATWEAQSGNYGRDLEMATDSIGYYLASDISNPGNCMVFRTIHGGWIWTNIQENQVSKNAIYTISPNPASEQIIFSSISSIPNQQYRVEVYNTSGEILLSHSLSHKTILSIDNLNSGIYLYAIINQNKTVQTGKFIKH